MADFNSKIDHAIDQVKIFGKKMLGLYKEEIATNERLEKELADKKREVLFMSYEWPLEYLTSI